MRHILYTTRNIKSSFFYRGDKTTVLDGEEEFWINQHQQPNDHGILVESQHGIAFKRFHNMQHAHGEAMNNWWGADDWARYPDIYDNQKKWYALRNDTWEEEMATLEVYKYFDWSLFRNIAIVGFPYQFQNWNFQLKILKKVLKVSNR